MRLGVPPVPRAVRAGGDGGGAAGADRRRTHRDRVRRAGRRPARRARREGRRPRTSRGAGLPREPADPAADDSEGPPDDRHEPSQVPSLARRSSSTSTTTATRRTATSTPTRSCPTTTPPSTGRRSATVCAWATPGLVIEIEHDAQERTNEFLAGFGKTARDGLLLKGASVKETCDIVISNVVVIDATHPHRQGQHRHPRGSHQCGRPRRQPRHAGRRRRRGRHRHDDHQRRGLIATAGAIDTHVHLLSPRIMEASLRLGVTTIIGQEFGPVWGVGVNSPWALRHAFNSFDQWPVNIGFLGRGSSSDRGPADRGARRGRCVRLQGARGHGCAHACARHRAERGRAVRRAGRAAHRRPQRVLSAWRTRCRARPAAPSTRSTSRAAAAGTCPTCCRLAGVPNVLGSSTNPTLPFGRDALDEHYEMIFSATA
jgi:urease subunit alpha